MKRISLLFFSTMGLIVSLNLLSCGSGGGGASSTGPLDPDFGTGGKVTTAIGTTMTGIVDDEAFALVLQPDGKLVAAGKSYDSTAGAYRFALIRYNSDGTLDTGFGTDGIVTTAIGSIDDEAFALAIQSDGKLVAAGYTRTGSQYEFALVRYETDGSLDTTFGAGGTGIVTTAIGSVDDQAFALAVQPDGKLVASGYSNNGSQRVFALARYNTNGTLDTSFDTDGIVTTVIGTRDQAFALAIQSGKLVAAGSSRDSSTGTFRFALARYNTDGTPDTGFGTGGIVTTPIGSGGNDAIRALATQLDGKLVSAGYSNNHSQFVFALARYNTDGTLDTSFGSGGIVTTASIPLGRSNFAFALAIQSNQKLVAAGYSNNGSQSVFANEFAVARYNTTGSLDTSFAAGGIATTPIGTVDDEAFALVFQPDDDKLVAAGKSYNSATGTYQFGLIRYSPSP